MMLKDFAIIFYTLSIHNCFGISCLKNIYVDQSSFDEYKHLHAYKVFVEAKQHESLNNFMTILHKHEK